MGTPIPSASTANERLSKKRGFGAFSPEALSSVAYASEEILRLLIVAGSASLAYSLPISLAIVMLLFVVVFSYRQTIFAYPNGGGAYVVSKENLGETAALIAASSLLLDYVLTVSVSIAAATEALTSAFPVPSENRKLLCLVAIFVVTFANLRGLKETSKALIIPTYAFLFSIMGMLVYGCIQLLTGKVTSVEPSTMVVESPLTLFLLLKAFTSGCIAMTGIETFSNGVPAFRYPESKNASKTLLIVALVLGVMFLGVTFLSHYHGIIPIEKETVLSQLAGSIFGKELWGVGFSYYLVQFATFFILVMAANKSYSAFPRLASLLARDRYLPRQLATLGDRLVFSNGIIMLSILASVLIFAFDAKTHHLIPLYAIGVFLSFTLSQAGMVRYWLSKKNNPNQKQEILNTKAIIINSIGCLASGVIVLIFAITKFAQGTWIIIALVPVLFATFKKIRNHYVSIQKQLSVDELQPEEFSKEIKHTVVLPISGVHRGVVKALRYAQSIAADVRAIYVEIDPSQTDSFKAQWQIWGRGIPLVILKSPYRSVITPFLKYVDEVEESKQDDVVTVVIPEFVTARWWEQILHNQTALMIRTALLFKKGKVVTSVRYHLD